ncbi:MAG: hypothetical protein H0U16_05215 [Actinobacteria bacterium]|nr:hypothetical protein [Actinomycetota bacterium]
MEEDEIVRQESTLRDTLRSLGLEWVATQVDEGLANEASETGEIPSPAHRLATLAEALSFAVEIVDSAEREILRLVDDKDLPTDQRPTVTAVRFIDPVRREDVREIPHDRDQRRKAVDDVRLAADALRQTLEDGR